MSKPKKCPRTSRHNGRLTGRGSSYAAAEQTSPLALREDPQTHPGPHTRVVEQPFSGNIRAGKNTYVYDAHTYHTKVPPEGIAKLIEYYTEPAQVVLDPFCGSGMTGVAAGNLGRKALLSDLSPAATFIARHLNTPVDADTYLKAVRTVLQEAAELEAKLYQTPCRSCGTLIPMLYMVWSYGVICPTCKREFVLWDVARDEKPSIRESKVLSEFPCPHCKTRVKKRGLKRTRRYPVQVGYKCCGRGLKEQTSAPCRHDYQVLARIEAEAVPAGLWYPKDHFPKGVNTRQPIAAGIRRVDQAYTARALYAMAWLWRRAQQWPDSEIAGKLLFTLTSLYQRVTVFSEFRFWGGSGNTANYNVPFISNEQNVFRTFHRKAKTISWYFQTAPKRDREIDVRTASACNLKHVSDQSVDYVFTDPPFGGNINYSEMNFLWESWLQRHTDTREEAIINAAQGKGCAEYRTLLTRAFRECRRALKDGGWMTVIFHNSSSEVWAALRAAISGAGFAVRGTQTFDKEHGTFKQFVSDNAVGYDLVLHCQKAEQPALVNTTAAASHRDVVEFVRHRVGDDPQRYRVRFLHVSRTDEWDFRKLHAEWLAERLPHEGELIGFEEFRRQAQSAVAGIQLKPLQAALL
ncbi:MAG: DNA methyltransferase [Verrucomicrobiota bacterium]|jgi:DNA modification methylase